MLPKISEVTDLSLFLKEYTHRGVDEMQLHKITVSGIARNRSCDEKKNAGDLKCYLLITGRPSRPIGRHIV